MNVWLIPSELASSKCKNGVQAMPHKSSWLVEKRILLIDYEGVVDKYEVRQLNDDLENFHAQGLTPIHIISDNSKMGKADLSIQLARETFTSMRKEGWGWVIFVGLGRLVRFFAEVFATQFGIKIKMANSLEEAMVILKKLDGSLEETA